MASLNALKLSGELTYQTVVAEQSRLTDQLSAGSNLIDFTEVSRVDSSALALCLSVLRSAADKGCEVSFTGFPDELKAIADLVALDLTLLNHRN